MQRITLGEYPLMTLAQATVAANRRTADLHEGRNPIAEKQKEEQAAVVASDELTFGKLADRYVEEYAKVRKKSWKDDEWVLARAKVEFGPRVLSTITRKELVKFLRGLGATSVRNCNKTQASICTMYNWANLEDETIINPLARLPKVGGKEREEDRVLSDDELRLLWPALAAPDGAMSIALGIALKLIFLTAQRPLQVSGMRVDELVDLDGPKPRWDLPAIRMKRPKPHSVPLSAEAVKQIKAALALRHRKDSPFVFPSTRGGGEKPIERHALSHAALRLRKKLGMAEWSPHDARRSATTWARAMGIPRDTTDALTHHAIIGSGRAYDRYDMQAEKLAASNAIASYIARVLRPKVKMRRKAA
jgi:integrase